MIWGALGGRVENRSSKWIIVAYDHPNKKDTWGHSYLAPGQSTPSRLDVDGFRVYDTDVSAVHVESRWPLGGRTRHFAWWKVKNGQTAIVHDGESSNEVAFKVLADAGFGQATRYLAPEKKTDGDFGWDYGNGVLPL